MSGLGQLLPDVGSLLAQRDGAQGGTAQLMASLGSLASAGADSPVAPVVRVIGELRTRLDIDVSALSNQLPQAITTVQNAVPAGVVEYVSTLDTHYAQARSLLLDSPLAQAVEQGDLQAVALAVIEEALELFRDRLATLVGGVFPPATLTAIADVLAAFERFHGDFTAHRDEFLPFLARYLVGVEPGLLQQPLGQLNALIGGLAALEAPALDSLLAPARDALAAAYAELLDTVTSFDAARDQDYARLDTALATMEQGIDTLLAALPPIYDTAHAAVASPVVTQALEAYSTALDAVVLDQVPSINDVVTTIGAALEDLLARVRMTLSAEEVSGRLDELSRTIRDNFLSSSLGQVRRTLTAFLDQIRAAIESIPTEMIQQTVEQMLGRVRQEIEQLGIDQVGARISQAFSDARSFITTQLDEQVIARVREALNGLSEQVRSLPIADLVANLNGAITQLQNAIAQVQQLVADQIDSLRSLLSQLDTLSYEPISNEIIGEIDQIKARLAAINPNALSDVEKLAIQGALAVLEAIDLNGQIAGQLKPAYHSAEGEVKRLLDDITAALQLFRDQIGVFSPETLLEPVMGLLDQITGALTQVNGRMATAPLEALVGELVAQLERISPASLLDPLQAPYDHMLAIVGQLDPAHWLAPLNTIYAEIDRLIAKVDITPLLADLDQRRARLFAEARQQILDGIAALNLPAPLDSLLDQIAPLIAAITDALLGDPATAAPQLALDLRTGFRLSSLFTPLDLAFDQLIELLDTIPPDDLLAAVEGIRVGLGVGFAQLDPERLAGRLAGLRAALAERSPAQLLGGPQRLPALHATFEARASLAPDDRQPALAALHARFDALIQIMRPGVSNSRLLLVERAHDTLVTSLDQRTASLASGPAAAAYTRLRSQLERLLPAFLRQPEPLSHATALAGIAALRPGTQAARLDSLLDRFLASVQPLADQLAELSNGFFGAIRDAVQLINPLTLRDHVATIYDAVRAKIRIINPDTLAAAIRTDVLEPLLAPLQAINPATIKAQLQTLYESLLAALRDGAQAILGQVSAAIDELLQIIREQVRGLITQVKAAIAQALHAVVDILAQLEGLVFVEILGRLRALIDKLGVSFDRELDRILNAFEQMLHAIPLGGSASAGGAV